MNRRQLLAAAIAAPAAAMLPATAADSHERFHRAMLHETAKPLSLIVKADTAPLDAALTQIKQLPKSIRDGLVRRLEAGEQFFCLEPHTTAGAIEVTLKPSDSLLEFLAAAGAGKLDAGVLV